MNSLDFLASDNVCGQTLLRLVARGSSIITEILRLSEHLPAVFAEPGRFASIALDFAYLRAPRKFDTRIDGDAKLSELDDEFREAHMEMISRCYRLFSSIIRFAGDLHAFLDDLDDGAYAQHSLAAMARDHDARQLLVEALQLQGAMLLLLDMRFPGVARERLVVAYHRYKGAAASDQIDHVVRLVRHTGFEAPYVYGKDGAGELHWNSVRRPSGYPVQYFSRVPVRTDVAEMLVKRMRADDVFHQTVAWPEPEQRSTALAQQASALVLLLFLAPEVLHRDDATMRELVDKHFADNWCVALYHGVCVDLEDTWKDFGAAKRALSHTLRKERVRVLLESQTAELGPQNERLRELLADGVLSDDAFVARHWPRLLKEARGANAALRFWILHRYACHRPKLRARVCEAAPLHDVLKLLLQTAEFEFLLREVVESLLKKKREVWNSAVSDIGALLGDLGALFRPGGEALPPSLRDRVRPDAQLASWFDATASRVQNLQREEGKDHAVGRQIASVMQALGEVQDAHQMQQSLRARELLDASLSQLGALLRMVNVSDGALGTLAVIGDASFAWQAVQNEDVVQQLQHGIRHNPAQVRTLRCVFLKLATMLDLPLVRINQCASGDVKSVAQFYSAELVRFIRRVLQVIPLSMFGVLKEIVRLQGADVGDAEDAQLDKDAARLAALPAAPPSKFERASTLRSLAMPVQRFALSRATERVAVFTDGILAMQTTLVGVVQLEPKQMLEDGLRRELVRRVALSLHEEINFRAGVDFRQVNAPVELLAASSLVLTSEVSRRHIEQALNRVGRRLASFKQALEYVQDFLSTCGLQLWQSEFARIVQLAVERESSRFLRQRRVYDERRSALHSDVVPVPALPVPKHDKSGARTFVGRIAHQLLWLSSPRNAIFVGSAPSKLLPGGVSSWMRRDALLNHRAESQRELPVQLGAHTTALLLRSVGVHGVHGVSQVLGFMLVHELRALFSALSSAMTSGLVSACEKLRSMCQVGASMSDVPRALATAFAAATRRIRGVREALVSVGHKQLLRRALSSALRSACGGACPSLGSAVDTLDQECLNKPLETDSEVLRVSAMYAALRGAGDVRQQIYCTSAEAPSPLLPQLLLLVCAGAVLVPTTRVLLWHPTWQTLVPSSKELNIDGMPFAYGVATVLRQCHPSLRDEFLHCAGAVGRSLAASEDADSFAHWAHFIDLVCQAADVPSPSLSAAARNDELLLLASLPDF